LKLDHKETIVSHTVVRRRTGLLGLLLAVVAVAPSPADKPRRPSPTADARYRAAVKQFGEVWIYYKQSRTESFPVYYWSRLVLDSQRELTGNPADHIAALEGHEDRMEKLEALVHKVRRLGFGFSTDVGATAYYRLEAQHWLEEARSR
jgi:hypothetical protein